MAKKQQWSPRRPTRATVRIELVFGPGIESDLESIDLAALKKTVEDYVQHGTFKLGLVEALDGSGQPVDVESWRVRVEEAHE